MNNFVDAINNVTLRLSGTLQSQ